MIPLTSRTLLPSLRDPFNIENYRPIALLQTFYKLLAAMIKWRLLEGTLDTQNTVRVSATQINIPGYIFLTRRLMDLAERQGTNIWLILLDLEKTLDRIEQKKPLQVLQ